MNPVSKPLVALLVCGASTTLFAQSAQPVACPPGYTSAAVDIDVNVSTSAACPLLDDRELRKLVDKFGTGYTFAGPGTCMSGTILSGSTITAGGKQIAVQGSTESAQRYLPEGAAVYGSPSLFLDGGGFISGAAMTVVSLSLSNPKSALTLVLDDRFTINKTSGLDTEDMLVLGSSGNFAATGRLVATGYSIPDEYGSTHLSPLSVSGTLCMK